MTQQFFTIAATLPGLNEIIKVSKAHPMAYSNMKKTWGATVEGALRQYKLKPMRGPVSVHFFWVEPTKRRDPDNIRTGSKFILDALVKAGILPTDGQKTVWKITDAFRCDKKNPRVDVILTQVEVGCD